MPEKLEKTEVKEVKAYARYVHISPRKARLVANLIKKGSVEEALVQLSFLNKKAAKMITKVVESGVANAVHNFQLSRDQLFVKSLTVDGGPVTRRYTPKAQGRATPIRKQTSHINLVLGVSPHPLKISRAKKSVIVPKADEPTEQVSEAQLKGEGSKSRFAFWKNRGKKSQIPVKQDPKSKKYTAFDRRSGS